jgi:lipoprotein-anchoring transpeptidase ErfK/SrfK
MKRFISVALAVIFAASVLAVPADARRKRHHQVHHQVHKKHHKKVRRKAAPAVVVAKVDVSSQTMSVTVNGFPYAYWRVSTGRKGFYTPYGSFRVGRMAKMHYSKKYDNAPMPNSLFFLGGFAIHGTGHTKQLGRPASHGCVRLAPGNAATLYSLAQKYGGRRVRVVIVQ